MFEYGIFKYLLLSVPELLFLTQILLKLNSPEFTVLKKRIVTFIFLDSALNFMASDQTSVSMVLSTGALLLSILYSFNFYKINSKRIVYSVIFIFIFKTLVNTIYTNSYSILMGKNLLIMPELEYCMSMIMIFCFYSIAVLHYKQLSKIYNKGYKIYRKFVNYFNI